MKDRHYDDVMVEMYRNNPALAAAMLDDILKDNNDQGELLVTMRQMTKAFGGIPAVARTAELNTTHVYRVLSQQGNPELRSLNALLRAMGLRLAIQPLAL